MICRHCHRDTTGTYRCDHCGHDPKASAVGYPRCKCERCYAWIRCACPACAPLKPTAAAGGGAFRDADGNLISVEVKT